MDRRCARVEGCSTGLSVTQQRKWFDLFIPVYQLTTTIMYYICKYIKIYGREYNLQFNSIYYLNIQHSYLQRNSKCFLFVLKRFATFKMMKLNVLSLWDTARKIACFKFPSWNCRLSQSHIFFRDKWFWWQTTRINFGREKQTLTLPTGCWARGQSAGGLGTTVLLCCHFLISKFCK